MYDELVAALKDTAIPFAEYAWDQRPEGTYGVIAPDTALHQYADNRTEHQSPQGTVDLFTDTNDRTQVETVQTVLNSAEGCSWYLNSIQYETDTRLIHWEWVFTLDSW